MTLSPQSNASTFRIVARRYGLGQVAQIDQFASLDYALVENDVGALSLVIPDDPVLAPPALLQRDTWLEVYRTIGGWTKLEGEKGWFVRDVEYILNQAGERLIRIVAFDWKHLLKRRIVNAVAGSAESRKTSAAFDDIAKAFVRENLGSSAAAARRFPGLTVDINRTACPVGSKSAAWRNVLTVLQELAQASATQGIASPVYLSFDIVKTGDDAMEFRTYVGQRFGNSSLTSGQTLILSPEAGTLADVRLVRKTSDEANVVKVGGVGEGEQRITTEVSTAARLASSFNYIEAFTDARNGGTTTAELQAEGYQTLRERGARQTFAAKFVQTDLVRYGLQINWGDRVVCQYGNIIVDNCRADRVRVRVTPEAGEQIDIAFSKTEELQ
jgi:hypothetical protein